MTHVFGPFLVLATAGSRAVLLVIASHLVLCGVVGKSVLEVWG